MSPLTVYRCIISNKKSASWWKIIASQAKKEGNSFSKDLEEVRIWRTSEIIHNIHRHTTNYPISNIRSKKYLWCIFVLSLQRVQNQYEKEKSSWFRGNFVIWFVFRQSNIAWKIRSVQAYRLWDTVFALSNEHP